MNQNEVVLIYADQNKKDLGVLQDYSFDMCYGDSENNFECRIQKYNVAMTGDTPITEDYILYIEFTEYGGIVDRISVDTKNGEVVLSGRTWHGFLNSFVIEPKKGRAHRYYQGDANAVISQIISELGLTSWFSVEPTNSGINIPFTIVRYEHAYDCIMSMLLKADAKLAMWYQRNDGIGGKIHLEAFSRVNTGAFDEFDTSQIPFTAGKTFNKVNDLICLGKGEGTKRAVIHLYTDDNGGVLPYCRDNPMQDSDYYTDLTALSQSTNPEDIAKYAIISSRRVTGTKKYMEIYDNPGAEIRTNYVRLSEVPDNWDGVYTKYFYLDTQLLDTTGEEKYVQFTKEYMDEYRLTKSRPDDWESNYKDYFVKKKNSSTKLSKVEALPESQSTVKYRPNTADDGYEGLQSVDPNVWQNYFKKKRTSSEGGYYERTGMYGEDWQEVQPETVESYKLYSDNGEPPFDWLDNYGSYYLRRWNGAAWEYYSVPGIEENTYLPSNGQTKMPTDWTTNYGSYYFKATEKVIKDNKVVIKKGLYYTVADGISNDLIEETYTTGKGANKETHNYPKWKKKTFYTRVTTYRTPWYEDGTVYYKVTKSVAPTFVAGKYYQKYIDSAPQWRRAEDTDNGFGGYWKLFKKVEQIPNPEYRPPYKEVEDRYAELIEGALEKLEQMADTDTLDIDLELESAYDVGDIVGGTDIETGIDVAKPILRKIIKIKKDILSVDYEVD